MHHGKIVEEGRSTALFESPRIEHFVHQFQDGTDNSTSRHIGSMSSSLAAAFQNLRLMHVARGRHVS